MPASKYLAACDKSALFIASDLDGDRYDMIKN